MIYHIVGPAESRGVWGTSYHLALVELESHSLLASPSLSLFSLSLCPVPCPAGVARWYGVLGLGAKARSRMYLGSGRWASTILSRGEVCCRRREVVHHLVQALQEQSYLLVEVAVKMKGRRKVRKMIEYLLVAVSVDLGYVLN